MKVEYKEKAEQYYKSKGGYKLASWNSDDNVFDETVLISFAADFAESLLQQREEAERDVLKWWFGKGISDERLNEILEDYKSNSNEQQVPTTN